MRVKSLVQFGQLYDPIRNTYFKVSKLFIRINQNFCTKTQIFPEQAIAKIFSVLQSTYSGDTTCNVWFTLNNSMVKSKTTILIVRNYSFEIIAKLCLKTWYFLEARYSRNSFCSRLFLHRGYCTWSLVQFGPVFDSLKKSYFQN